MSWYFVLALGPYLAVAIALHIRWWPQFKGTFIYHPLGWNRVTKTVAVFMTLLWPLAMLSETIIRLRKRGRRG